MIENYGQRYVAKLIETLKEVPVSAIREYVRNLLIDFVVLFGQESQLWFQEALSPVF